MHLYPLRLRIKLMQGKNESWNIWVKNDFEYLNAKNSTLYDIEALTLHVEWKKNEKSRSKLSFQSFKFLFFRRKNRFIGKISLRSRQIAYFIRLAYLFLRWPWRLPLISLTPRLRGISFPGLPKPAITSVNKGEDVCRNGKIDIGCTFVLYAYDNFHLSLCNFFMPHQQGMKVNTLNL